VKRGDHGKLARVYEKVIQQRTTKRTKKNLQRREWFTISTVKKHWEPEEVGIF